MTTGDVPTTQQSPYRNSGFSDNSIVRRSYKIFDVKTSTYLKARSAKKGYKRYDNYFDEPEIKEFAKKYPKDPVIIRHKQTGEMIFFRNGAKTLESLRNFKKIYR
jgi:hypothetical protein